MMKLQKFIAGTLLLLGLIVPVMVMPGDAQAEDELLCGGGGDYLEFLMSIQTESTRRSYFADLFQLSYCQINDILELYDELDTVKDQLRSASYDCEETSTYKTQYLEILMEIYFVRNAQKRDPGVTKSTDSEEIEDTKDLLLDELREEMREVFVEDLVDDDTFDDYFDVWEYKYYDRIGEYARCEEGAWAELTETWNSFVETIRELGEFNLDPAERSMFDSSKFSADVKGEESILDPVRDTFAPNKSVEEDSEHAIITTIGNEPTLEDAVKASYTIEGAFNQLVIQAGEYDREAEAIDRLSEYHRLYGQGGAQTTTNLQTKIQEVSESANQMSLHLAAIKDKLQTIIEKQCSE